MTGRGPFDLVVVGAGPGGYAAAFRAADLGLRVALVERHATLGGVCLNVGCIPSKALLHAAGVVEEAAAFADRGLRFGAPEIDVARLRAWKDSVVARLTTGLGGLARRRRVEVVRGVARFAGRSEIAVATSDGAERRLGFGQAIVAVGSRATALPELPEDPRLVDSTGALALPDVPERLLVVGGGIIGLELACVYHALGSRVTVVEALPRLLPGTDPDLVRPLAARIGARYEAIHLETRVARVAAGGAGLTVTFEGRAAPPPAVFDRVLVAIGRAPNGRTIEAERAGIEIDERGFLPVDDQMRTSAAHVFAVGDVARPPMLAHKATHEGHVAAEVAAGERSGWLGRVVPAVAYTDPEIAWVGLTEEEAAARGVRTEKSVFPWAASGRALGLGRDDGLTKLLFDPASDRLLGMGAVGPHAGDLVAEAALAIEMGAVASDVGLTVHPHPTLSETVAFAAEAYDGTLTDLYLPRAGARRRAPAKAE